MPTDTLSPIFAALADPTRRAILAQLSLREMSVGELSKPFKLSGPAISKHLNVLERSGLISRGRDAQWRPCRLNADPFRDVADWMQQYRQYWEESFDRLDAYLKTVTAKKKAAAKANAKGKKHGRKK